MPTKYVTWLDWYADGAAKRAGKNGSDIDALRLFCLVGAMGSAAPDLVGAMRQCALAPDIPSLVAALENKDAIISESVQAKARECSVADPDEAARRIFFAAVSAIIDPHGHGLKLSPRLVRAFAHARAPATDDWKSTLTERAWYLDIPHNSLLIGPHQIRAILTHPNPFNPRGGVAAVAMLTPPGSDEIAGRYAWMMIGERETPIGSANGEDDMMREEVQQKATDFVALSLLYYRSLERTERTERIQRLASGKGKSKIQRKLERKTRSLFTIHVLPEPAGNFGRPIEKNGASDGGWKLDHRVTVRGHFRWQPCGPQRSRRELRWIEEHTRGTDLPEKPALMPLRKVH